MTRGGIAVAVTGQALLHGPVDLQVPGAESVCAILKDSFASFANLEASVAAPGAWPTKTKTLHLTTPPALACLREMGLTAVGHANNHAFDIGPPGIIATHRAACDSGLAIAGSGRDLEQAAATVFVGEQSRVAVIAADMGPQGDIVYAGGERAGINPLRIRRSVTVPASDFAVLQRLSSSLGDQQRERARANVGYRDTLAANGLEFFGVHVEQAAAVADVRHPDTDDLARLEKSVGDAKRRADLVLLSLHNHHWDADWRRPTKWFLDLSRRLIDAGADIIVGTGAPLLQGLAFHRGKPICAGLGNFIFHTWRAGTYAKADLDVWTGVMLRCHFDEAGQCREIGVLPVNVGRPEPGPRGLPPAPSALEGARAQLVYDHLVADLTADERRLIVKLWRRDE